LCASFINIMEEVLLLIILVEELLSELNVLKGNVEEVRVSL